MKKIFFFITLSLSAAAYAQEYSWQKFAIDEDLYQVRDKELLDGERLSDINQHLIQEINTYQPHSPFRTNGLTKKQAQKIYNLVNNGPVTSLWAKFKYDPTGAIGFCFGRALYSHLELLRHGVNKQAIKKAFMVGPMQTDIPWQFHVATLVRAKDASGWYAIDTYMGKVVRLEEWVQRLQRLGPTGELRLFITEPGKIGPSAPEYNIQEGGLLDPFYNDYFKDIFANFKQHPLNPAEKFPSPQVRSCTQVLNP